MKLGGEQVSLRIDKGDKREVTQEELRSHQMIAKKALDEIKAICEKHGIQYYLLAGSCLGAVRHKGFIPWDDDIDIGILRKDYDLFDSIVADELSDEYTWISNTTSETFPRLFGKVLHKGVGCVDCFQLVKTADDKKHRGLHRFIREIWLKVYLRSINRYWPGENRLYYVISVILGFFTDRDRALKLVRRNEMRYEKKDTDHYLNINSVYSTERETIDKQWLFPPGTVTFEGEEYTTVNDTDAYLKHLYGDYMVPPPPEKRHLMHIDYEFGN